LVAIDIESGDHEVLVSKPEEQSLGAIAAWSPNGEMVPTRWVPKDPEQESKLCLSAVSSATTRCFPEAGRVFTFDWSPDGERLVVAGRAANPSTS
jgi:hypothetical protein